MKRYRVPVIEAVVAGSMVAVPCAPRTTQRWRHDTGAVIGSAIATLTSRVQCERSVGRQEHAFLKGTPRGYAGLRAVSRIAERHTLPNPASCVLGWAYQIAFPLTPRAP